VARAERHARPGSVLAYDAEPSAHRRGRPQPGFGRPGRPRRPVGTAHRFTELSRHKRETGYRYEPRKFDVAGLTPEPSDLVAPDRVAECPIQLECRVSGHYSIDNESSTASAIHVEILRAHVADSVRLPGTDHIDPLAWDPLIMKFCDFFGASEPLIPSRLAAGWRMPGRLEEPASA
jgi:hypothetical protein